MSCIEISGKKIGINHPPFVVAEVGINHNGNLLQAFEMISVAKEAGADAVKFQTFQAEEFVSDPAQLFSYKSQGKIVTESMVEMFKRYQFSPDVWKLIKKKCDEEGIVFLSTPQNYSDLELLLPLGLEAIKVGSDDFTHLPLLKKYSRTGLPLVLSAGMADMAEVYNALYTVGSFDGYPTVLLHCTSQYPTPPEDMNLNKIDTLRNSFPMIIVGYSDHTQGSHAALIARVKGAHFFEKHFTLDHSLQGPDHWFSANPEELKEWIATIRSVDIMLGSGVIRPTVAEQEMRKLARRSVVALRNIKKGEKFSEDNIGLKRPGLGLSPEYFNEFILSIAARDIKQNECLDWKVVAV